MQVGLPEDRDLPLPSGRPGPTLRTAIGRAPVEGPVHVGPSGAAGDAVGDTEHHGGPDKALCAYVVDHLPFWRARLDREMEPGAFGENLSLTGADEGEVAVGDVYEVGTAVVQVSQPRGPCATLARRWQVHDLVTQVRGTGWTGWYLRVLRSGSIAAGMSLRLRERPHPEWTIARCNEVAYRERPDASTAAQAAVAAELEALSAEWRMMLRRVARG